MSGAYPTPTGHQDYQGLPKIDTPLITANGAVSLPWYRFFILLFQLLGGSKLPNSTALVLNGAAGLATIYNALSGTTTGYVPVSPTPVTSTIYFTLLSQVIQEPGDVLQQSGFHPPTPVDQIRIFGHPASPMDQIHSPITPQSPSPTLNMANVINQTLSLRTL